MEVCWAYKQKLWVRVDRTECNEEDRKPHNFFMKPTEEMSNYKCHDIFMYVTNDKYVYFIACGMGVLKKTYNFRIFYCAKKGKLTYN
jgi:hypothetical protein